MELKDTSLLARQESKKPEKLASAIYLITGFFNDQEPLKWKLRALASELVSLAVSLKERQIATFETKDIVLKITGLLSVAKDVGLISAENHNLMQGEFIKYVDALDYPINISNFLNIGFSKPETKDTEGSPIIKDKTRYELLEKGQSSAVGQKSKSLREFGVISVKKNSRQSIIITVLKRKKEVMIRDISSLISGCSEKTVQRELSAMVQAGIIRKMGEKRWSRYSLAHP